MSEKIKTYKLYYIQSKYNKIITTINNIEEHYNELLKYNILESSIDLPNIIYEIIKNLNTQYNNSITTYLEKNDTEVDNIINNINEENTDESVILNILASYINDIPNDLFIDSKKEIDKLIKKYGYRYIKLLIEYLFSSIESYFSKEVIDLINELNDIVIPISYNIFNISNINSNYYWKIPTKYEPLDILYKRRELWIKLKNVKSNNLKSNNLYLKIDVIFKIDKFASRSKTSQLNSPILQNKKVSILNVSNIDSNFIKSFIRHDYLGNIYCMTEYEYIDYLLKMYNRYIKLKESTFVTVMKEFINNDNMKKMYEMILLLLIGEDNMNEIASVLFGLIKENKIKFSISVAQYIYENITFYLQSKIKKADINIKSSVDKLKHINIEDIDYKKQLIINKNIPLNVKSLVLEKISELKASNNEYHKQLMYIKTILNYPWGKGDDIFYHIMSKNNKKTIEYLNNIETKLNNSCYGHEMAKKFLLQMIGKWISNPNSIGTCIGLVGPPGVGKTLLAKSISSALDIPFGQITLGGQNDGEILHGHGYTYSGSQPGMIIKKMVDMGKSRCILYFDELDKACSKHNNINEITSILIHLTDPNMNKTFQDRFFQGIEFPLDKVIMIFSYNDSSKVDPVLLDRLKEINVQPYTMEDKVNICKEYIVKEIAETVSMENEIIIDDDIIRYLIENYTNEAGVRDIKRKIEDIYLHMNIDKIYKRGEFIKNKKITLTIDMVINILKEPDTLSRVINDMPEIGIINGLYATPTGMGGITPIQIYPNMQHTNDKYEIKLTGKQGDVMKESIHCSLTAAIEWLKRNNYNVDELIKNNVKNGFHVHTPDGATPKDGPSGGTAFTCAFISRILNKPIKNDIAITGEIELTGKISKIGGLEFKLQGAKKAGVKTVYIPYENIKDINDIKKKYVNLIDDNFKVISVNNINEIINEILI
jgi:endopeptidase La